MRPRACGGTVVPLLLLAWPIVVACGPSGGSTAAASERDAIERGGYLVEGLLQCLICHSERDWDRPGAPPFEGRAGAGRVWSDDGTYRLVAPNLTPDEETGIGRWTDEQLERAIRRGIGHDGRVLSGAMWYRYFRHLSDVDVAAVIAFLRSLEPVHNPLPRTELPPEEQARLDSRPPLPLKPVDLTSSDPVELGRGLVMLADCAGCHTGWEAPRTPGLLGGGNLLEGEHGRVFSANLTPHTSGLSYSADAFIALMQTGKGGTIHPFMPWIVFRNLSDADLRAIHAFLQTVHPVAHYVDNHAESTYCPVCGQEHGLGEMNRLEPLEGIALDPATYPRYVGNFYSEDYDFTIAVSVAEGRLVVSDDGDPAVEMIPLSSARFVVPGEVAPLRFVFDANRRAMQVILEEVEQVVLERVDR